jgi:hydroxymethylpyrimidine/phosphomethylpyrimidine kinase
LTPRILVIAGSDSGAGAGIQADIKTIMALGGYAMTAITAVTAQNTQGVQGVWPMSPESVVRQMRAVLEDIGADAFKTGMLGDSAMIEAVAGVLAEYPGAPFVLDPVMVAKGGHPLLDSEAVGLLKAILMPMASVITPNLPEAEKLTGQPIRTELDIMHAARALLRDGARAVLLKGGHLAGDRVVDLLVTQDGFERLEAPRAATRHTHGTGCTLASAIAVSLGQGAGLRQSVRRAHDYVQGAIAAAPGFGAGHGPLGHGVGRREGGV